MNSKISMFELSEILNCLYYAIGQIEDSHIHVLDFQLDDCDEDVDKTACEYLGKLITKLDTFINVGGTLTITPTEVTDDVITTGMPCEVYGMHTCGPTCPQFFKCAGKSFNK